MREAEPEDVEVLEELENTLFPNNSMNAHTLLNELHFSKCFVEECDEKLAGYVIARTEHDLVDVLRVGVHPEFHRRGIARALMKRALPMARKATLLVRKSNDPAIKLYLSLGFKIVGHVEGSWAMLRG